MSEQKQIVAKLIRVYNAIDCVEKSGHNKTQNYDYVRAADVVRAVRKAFIDEGLYAEINMEFAHPPYTIARAKDPSAPFAATNVRCTIVIHDTATGETTTASGLGTGADSSDKAVYKAQTGALKYALRHAALLPDEADPEADESVDEDAEPRARQRQQVEEMPDFQEAQKTTPAPRPTQAAKPAPAEASAATKTASFTAASSNSASNAAAPSTETTAQDVESTSSEMPTEEEMNGFRQRFSTLGNDLSTQGKLKASRGLPVNRKILIFLLSVTKAADAKVVTKAQWLNFFERVVKVTGTVEEPIAGGFVALAKLVNKANGIEPEEKV